MGQGWNQGLTSWQPLLSEGPWVWGLKSGGRLREAALGPASMWMSVAGRCAELEDRLVPHMCAGGLQGP